MAFIRTISEEQAEGLVKEQYEADRKSAGYVHNYVKALSIHPEVYAAWVNLISTVRSKMKMRRYELVTLATAMALDCSY